MSSTALISPAVDELTGKRPVAELEERSGGTSVAKALNLLESFRGATDPLGVSELARRAGVAKSTAFRLLAVLEEGQFIERVGKNYQLSWQIFELGNQVRHSRYRGLHDAALPYLCELFSQTRQVVHLSVLEGDEVLCIEKMHGLRSVRGAASVGTRLPVNCTAVGKIMLAFSDAETIRGVLSGSLEQLTPRSIAHPGVLLEQLKRARAEGVAYDREESHMGLATVAAPILSQGRAIAAVSVAVPASLFNPKVVIDAVRAAAEQISAMLVAAA